MQILGLIAVLVFVLAAIPLSALDAWAHDRSGFTWRGWWRS